MVIWTLYFRLKKIQKKQKPNLINNKQIMNYDRSDEKAARGYE